MLRDINANTFQPGDILYHAVSSAQRVYRVIGVFENRLSVQPVDMLPGASRRSIKRTTNTLNFTALEMVRQMGEGVHR